MHRLNRIPFLPLLFAALLLTFGCSKDSTNPVTPPDTTADTEAPAVSLVTPLANESVGRATLNVEAQASDNKGVTKIEVYLDAIANPVATMSTPPWKTAISIAGLQDGDHTVYAKAFDAAGNTATSGTVTWKRGDLVDITPPTVSIASPKLNEAVGLTELGIQANADDNVGVKRVEFFIDGSGTPSAILTAVPWEAIVSIDGMSEGNHTVSAKAYDAAGNSGTSTPITFRRENVRMTLIEIVTSANCPPCAPANEYLKNNTKSLSIQTHLAVIKNHVWWPQSTDRLWHESSTWSQPRTEYLFSPSTQYYAPWAWISGMEMTSSYTTWVDQIKVDMRLAAEAKIVLQKSVSAGSATVNIQATGLSSASYNDLRLYTVVTESDIQYSDGNGELVHYDVMRTMLPDAGGESVTLGNGETKTFTRNIVFDSKWNSSHLKVVVFLQSRGSKKVLQAARISL